LASGGLAMIPMVRYSYGDGVELRNCMAWLWSSWDKYAKAVQPVAFDKAGYVRLAESDPLFEVEHRLWSALHELEKGTQSPRELGFTGKKQQLSHDPSILGRAQAALIVCHSRKISSPPLRESDPVSIGAYRLVLM
jgi:hypothetical protein